MMALDPKSAIAGITEAVMAARRGLAEDAIIDLDGLEAAVARLCAAAQAAPAAERPALAGELASLAEGLDRLAADIAHKGEAAQRCRAATAYGAGEGT